MPVVADFCRRLDLQAIVDRACPVREVAQATGAMTALRKLAGRRRSLLVGDSKLVSYANLRAMGQAGVAFIAPASKTYVDADVPATQDAAAATPVDYTASRDQDRPPDQRGRYRVTEDTMTLHGKRTRDPALPVRRVFVWPGARADAARANRARKLDRARDDLERLARGLGGRHYPDPDAVTARVGAIAASRRVKDYLRAQVGTNQAGKPTLAWSSGQAALDAEAASDGWYALLTNLTPAQADAAEVLRRFKGQEVVERRYSAFKGPLAVAPLFFREGLNRRSPARGAPWLAVSRGPACRRVVSGYTAARCLVSARIDGHAASGAGWDMVPRSRAGRGGGAKRR